MMGEPRLAGVVGYPVAHSLSPVLHRYWIEACGMKADYVRVAAAPEHFSDMVRSLRHAGFAGVNVTLPHKQAALSIADEADADAMATGAANLLLFHGANILARNTDVFGLQTSLEQEVGAPAIGGRKAVLLGAGGAARAAVLALSRAGAAEICIINRSMARAAAMVDALRRAVTSRLVSHPWSEWLTQSADAALVVNATRAGMTGAVALDLDLKHLPKAAVVYDLIYNPLETNLIAQARARGHHAVNGLGMLIWQAVPAFEAFFGAVPQVTPALRATLERAIGR